VTRSCTATAFEIVNVVAADSRAIAFGRAAALLIATSLFGLFLRI